MTLMNIMKRNGPALKNSTNSHGQKGYLTIKSTNYTLVHSINKKRADMIVYKIVIPLLRSHLTEFAREQRYLAYNMSN